MKCILVQNHPFANSPLTFSCNLQMSHAWNKSLRIGSIRIEMIQNKIEQADSLSSNIWLVSLCKTIFRIDLRKASIKSDAELPNALIAITEENSRCQQLTERKDWNHTLKVRNPQEKHSLNKFLFTVLWQIESEKIELKPFVYSYIWLLHVKRIIKKTIDLKKESKIKVQQIIR